MVIVHGRASACGNRIRLTDDFSLTPSNWTDSRPGNLATHEEPTVAHGRVASIRLAACAVAILAATCRAQTVSVRDYETPVSRARSLFADLRYSYERADTTTLANDGRLGLSYDLFYESLPFAYSVTAVGQWSRAWVADAFDSAYSLDGSARTKVYASRSHDVFASLSVAGSAAKGDDRPASDVTVAVGWGRFIDATALRKAVRIDTYFVDEGVTTERMPRDSMLRLAHIIESERVYRQEHGSATYAKYWLGAIEAEARRSGALTGEGVGAAGVFRVEEVLFRENIGDRFYGYDVAGGLRYDVTNADGLTPGAPRGDVTARYARPIQWSTQIDASLRVNTPLDANVGRLYEVAATVGYLYELTNRVDFLLDYGAGVLADTRGGPTVVTHAIRPSFLLYLEDELRLLATVRVLKPAGEPWRQELALTLNYKAF
jgi:hypothetical protein